MQRLIELYQRYKGPVFGYLYRMTGSPEDAEELTQETFYQAILSLHRFRGEAQVSTWLLRIARNQYLKRMRRAGREIPTDLDAGALPGSEPGPEQNLLQADEQEAVRLALERLPEQYRSVLVLREIQGLSHAEIGAILEKSEATVRVLVHRARQRLHQLYLQEERGG
ncbi:MAG: RNA polymerase sigma factor [Bacillota bacterium]